MVYFLLRSLNMLMIARAIEGIEWPFYWPSLESATASIGGKKGIRNYNLSWGSWRAGWDPLRPESWYTSWALQDRLKY